MLIDNGPCSVMVQNRKSVADEYGSATYAPDGDPILVRCVVNTVDSTEIEALGIQLEDAYRVICRRWPGDYRSLITWEGDEYEQVGNVRKYRNGMLSHHDDVLMKRTGATHDGATPK